LAIAAAVFIASAGTSYYFWVEANLPMTAERYARLCDNKPECYPEWGYILVVVLLFPVAATSGLILIIGLVRIALGLDQSKS
jgi:hypothetical protein